MGMVTGNIRVNKVTTAMAPEPIIITISNIARSSGTAPASATDISTGGMAIRSATATGRRGVILIDHVATIPEMVRSHWLADLIATRRGSAAQRHR